VIPFMSAAEIEHARARFRTDQEHAEYVEYTEAMGRIGRSRYWRRQRRRFLRAHGYGPTDHVHHGGGTAEG
jgi:hypothetical protein